MTKSLVLKPKLSEKAYALSEERNTYIFEVPLATSKQMIAQAVAKQFEVEVTDVRTSRNKGKRVYSYRRRSRRSHQGKRSDIQKAYVTLKEGDKIPVFAAVEEASKQSSEAEDK